MASISLLYGEETLSVVVKEVYSSSHCYMLVVPVLLLILLNLFSTQGNMSTSNLRCNMQYVSIVVLLKTHLNLIIGKFLCVEFILRNHTLMRGDCLYCGTQHHYDTPNQSIVSELESVFTISLIRLIAIGLLIPTNALPFSLYCPGSPSGAFGWT